MNFNILNPSKLYNALQVQTSTQNTDIRRADIEQVVPVRQVDKVTLSVEALSGEQQKRVDDNTYEYLATTQKKPAMDELAVNNEKLDPLANVDTSNFLKDAMAALVEIRLGVDKEKMEEIEAMMEEVAKDETLSPKEKERQLEELQALLEEELEKAAQKQAIQEVG